MLKKYCLGGFFWAPILHKWYQNMSGFACDSVCELLHMHLFLPETDCVEGLQGNKMPFFQKVCPKKKHTCPQYVE